MRRYACVRARFRISGNQQSDVLSFFVAMIEESPQTETDDSATAMVTVPKVSVLTTAYNPGGYLDVALESLYKQTFADFEHVLIDNGTTDGSIDALEPIDERCKLTRHENIGRTPALIEALELATGDYCAILDADDVWHPEHLERQVEWLDQNPECVLVATWCRWIDEQGREKNRTVRPTEPEDVRHRMAWENPISNSATMFRREVALKQGGYDNEYPFAQDFDLWIRMVQVGDAKILPEYLTDIRELTSSESHRPNPESRVRKAFDELRLYQKAGEQLKLDRDARNKNRTTTARVAVDYGDALIDAGRVTAGWKWKAWAMSKDPLIYARLLVTSIRNIWRPGKFSNAHLQ